MEHPAGESDDSSLRVSFDHRLRLEFHGSRITSGGSLFQHILGAIAALRPPMPTRC